MKAAPPILRLLGGTLLGALLLASLSLPMLSKGECTALLALAELDKPYVFGKEGPDSFDCSGLTRYAYGMFDIELIHSAQFVAYDNQYQTIENASDLLPGDLIFFDTVADKDKCDHVGIWLGLNRFVHASSEREHVMISSFNADWQRVYSWGKRILDHNPYAQFGESHT